MARCERTNPTAIPLASTARFPSQAEIAARSASASTDSERRRWQVLGLLAAGVQPDAIAAATGCRPRTIRQIAQRFREAGPEALVDGRQHSAGATPLLTPEQQDELRQALQQPPPTGGVWTGPKVAQWIAARIGKTVYRQRGWEYLRRLSDT